MQIKPQGVLLAMLSVLMILAFISAVFPNNGIVEIGKVKLKFLPWHDVLHVKYSDKKDKDVEKLIAKIDTSSIIKTESFTGANTDSIEAPGTKAEKINFNVVQRLEFGEAGPGVLFSFFNKIRSNKGVRILHYGDSQIEGDRMTGFLRQKLQSQFGGTGVGLIIPSEIYHTNAYHIALSDGWKRYTGFANIDPAVKHKKYGVMAAFSRFTEFAGDDSLIQHNPVKEAWIEIGASKAAYSNAQQFSHAKLFYGNCSDTVTLKIFSGTEEIYSSVMIPDNSYHTVDVAANSTILKYVFKGKDSPDIYAFSLEGKEGVMIDNIALRGASGTFFNSLDQNLQKQMFDDLQVEVFILQFGGNTVPYLDDEKEVSDYGNWLESQMRRLKKLRPDADFIVIGPSDMSTRSGDAFTTYPLLPKVVEAMKQAAFNSGAGFWDMYAAMGGENSMPEWVEKKLAGEDYTHFSPAGSKYIIQMFYDALMYEYDQYTTTPE